MVDRVITVLGVVTIVTVIGIIAATKGRPRNYLILQVVYYLGFFAPLLWIAYTNH